VSRLALTTSVPAPGMADGDYTDQFVEAGTTFSVDGPVSAAHVPVARAWVEAERLFMRGFATFDDAVQR